MKRKIDHPRREVENLDIGLNQGRAA